MYRRSVIVLGDYVASHPKEFEGVNPLDIEAMIGVIFKYKTMESFKVASKSSKQLESEALRKEVKAESKLRREVSRAPAVDDVQKMVSTVGRTMSAAKEVIRVFFFCDLLMKVIWFIGPCSSP